MLSFNQDDNYEMVDYVGALREGIAEAYVGIVSGLRGSNRRECDSPMLKLA